MSLEQYLPVLLFILVGLGVGLPPKRLVSSWGLVVQTPPKTPPMNAVLKHLKTRA